MVVALLPHSKKVDSVPGVDLYGHILICGSSSFLPQSKYRLKAIVPWSANSTVCVHTTSRSNKLDA